MKFVKPENSKNIEICFSDEEVQILNKTKKIILDPENYKIFGLNLIQVAMIMQDLDQTLMDSWREKLKKQDK